MNDIGKQKRIVNMPTPKRSTAKLSGRANSARGVSGRFFSPPAPEGAVTAASAWRNICARTGCSVTLSKFYKWIRVGRIRAIRVRGNYYIRIKTLDKLVEKALRGIGW